jgi:hypothetical protein
VRFRHTIVPGPTDSLQIKGSRSTISSVDGPTGSFLGIATIDFWLSADFWLMPGDEPSNIAGVSDKYDKRYENGELDALWVRPIGAADGHI